MAALLAAAPAIPVRTYGPGKTDAVIALVVFALLVVGVLLVVAFARASGAGPHHRAH